MSSKINEFQDFLSEVGRESVRQSQEKYKDPWEQVSAQYRFYTPKTFQGIRLFLFKEVVKSYHLMQYVRKDDLAYNEDTEELWQCTNLIQEVGLASDPPTGSLQTSSTNMLGNRRQAAWSKVAMTKTEQIHPEIAEGFQLLLKTKPYGSVIPSEAKRRDKPDLDKIEDFNQF